VQRKRVARLGALDVERSGLRVDEAQVDVRTRLVAGAAELAAERVLGPQPQRGAGGHAAHRRDTAERERVLLDGRDELDDVHVSGA
jgi:hypothetical protein